MMENPDNHMYYACDVTLSVAYIHTEPAWKICLATVGIEPTTFDSHRGQAYCSSWLCVDIHSE
jgi:hypothetical protein